MTLSKLFTPALAGASCLMAACATAPGVVPIGNDIYRISGAPAVELSSGVREEVRLIQIANRYCEAHGREATLVRAESMDGQLGAEGSGATTGVLFRCY